MSTYRVPMCGRHFVKFDDVTIYPVLVVARTGEKLELCNKNVHSTPLQKKKPLCYVKLNNVAPPPPSHHPPTHTNPPLTATIILSCYSNCTLTCWMLPSGTNITSYECSRKPSVSECENQSRIRNHWIGVLCYCHWHYFFRFVVFQYARNQEHVLPAQLYFQIHDDCSAEETS